MRRYELMLLLRPDLDDDRLQSAVEKVTRAIVNVGGSLSKVSPWGKRRLAYEISRHRDASYFLIHFDIEPAAVRGIERSLLISEEILRHMVTLLEDRDTGDADAERRPRVPARAGADDGALENGAPDDGAPEDGAPADVAQDAAIDGAGDDAPVDGTAQDETDTAVVDDEAAADAPDDESGAESAEPAELDEPRA